MEAITEFVGTVNGIVWGIPMLILILGAGLFLTIGLRFLSIMKNCASVMTPVTSPPSTP